MKTRIDLFKLHDSSNDTKLKNCIMAKGRNLKPKLYQLISPFKKVEITRDLMKEFNISQSSAERLVFMNKEWIPLFYIEYLLKLTNKGWLKYQIQDYIEFLKANQPPERIYRAAKILSPNFCKIVGAHTADGTMTKDGLIRITDGYKRNVEILKEWINEEFGTHFNVIRVNNSSEEWKIEFKSKVIRRYFNGIFDFPYGCKQYTTREPQIIKNSSLNNRKAFALGALTFEAGIGMKHQVELCVASKGFRDDISEILRLHNIKHHSMEKQSSSYWRLWSKLLTNEQAKQWMNFFAEGTDKWWLLKNYVDGFKRKVNSFEEAIEILNKVYPAKSASKVCLKDVMGIIQEVREVHRYQLAELLCKKNKLDSFGGTWAHSLKHYIDILKRADIISVNRRKFGKKKSWGSIVREVYIFNEDVSDWRLPYEEVWF